MKKILIALLFLMSASISYGATEYIMSVEPSTGEYTNINNAMTAITDVTSDITDGNSYCGTWDNQSGVDISDNTAINWDATASTGTLIAMNATQYAIYTTGTLNDNDQITDTTNGFDIMGTPTDCQFTFEITGTIAGQSNISGLTTDSDNYIKIKPASGEGHTGVSNVGGAYTGAALTKNGSADYALSIAADYTRVEDMIIHYITYKFYGALRVTGATTGVVVSNSIITDYGATDDARYALIEMACTGSGGNNCDLWLENNILVTRGGEQAGLIRAYFGSIWLYNNTVYNWDTQISGGLIGNVGGGQTVVGKNNIIYGYTQSLSGFDTDDYNAIQDGGNEGSGLNNRVNNSLASFYFTDTSDTEELDLHVTGTLGAGYKWGLDLSGTLYIDTDIDGDSRTATWDIGADQTDNASDPVCSASALDRCSTEGACTSAGGYWYDYRGGAAIEACHEGADPYPDGAYFYADVNGGDITSCSGLTDATRNAGTDLAITALTQADPVEVTTSGTISWSDGQAVYISGVGGMTQVDAEYTIDVTGTNTADLYVWNGTLGLTGAVALDGTGYLAYTSSGTLGADCALDHPAKVLGSTGHSSKIVSGDLLIINEGSYKIGWDDDNSWVGGNCATNSRYECSMDILPDGTATRKTRVYGSNWENCSSPQTQAPELWATGKLEYVFGLANLDYADFRCLNITDHMSCGFSASYNDCNSDVTDDHGQDGFFGSTSTEIKIKDVVVHGMGSFAIKAGKKTNWDVDNAILFGNYSGGFEGSESASNIWSDSGTIEIDGSYIGFNGCIESATLGFGYIENESCCTQGQGSCYGEGMSINGGGDLDDQPLYFYVRDTHIVANTSDGMDAIYDREGDTFYYLDRVRFEANVGNTLKLAGNSVVNDSIIIGNCGFFYDQPFRQDYAGGEYFVDCRSSGNTVNLTVGKAGDGMEIYGSTIYGQGDVMFEVGGNADPCDGTEYFIINNSILIGDDNFQRSDLIDLYYSDFQNDSTPICEDLNLTYSGTLYTNNIRGFKNSPITGTGVSNADPLIVGTFYNDDDLPTVQLLQVDVSLDSGSPALTGRQTGVGTSVDYRNETRGTAYGALEDGSVYPESTEGDDFYVAMINNILKFIGNLKLLGGINFK